MTKERDSVIDGLERLAWADGVQRATQDRAKALLTRLDAPVRVAVLGLPQSGKSTLVNVFAGESVVPREVMLPPVEIRFGDAPLLRVTEADGEVTVIDGLAFGKVSDDCVYIQAEAPVPVLREISLLEVAAEGTGEEQEAALRWASKRADITIWCSLDFARVEQILWASAPDQMKDHGFLAITKADQIGGAKDISSKMAVLRAVTDAEFLKTVAVASEAALQARAEDDDDAWNSSGAASLVRAVLEHAETGRRADLDAAHVFVLRHEDLVRSLPDAAPPEVDESELVLTPTSQPGESSKADPTVSEACAESAQYLRARAEEIATDIVQLGDEDAAAQVLDQCMETVEQLQELMHAANADSPCWTALMDEVSAANDMIVLMQLERGIEPAADAATLLLQLRRSFDAQAA